MQAQAIPLFKVRIPDAAHAMLKPVLVSGRLASGPQVAAFERQLAQWFHAPDALTLSDASAGLTLALYMAGVRPGDDVMVPAIACSATVMPIANLFARPVWCDVDPSTGMPGVRHLAAALTEDTRAILLYHWAGDVADVAAIAAFARDHGLKLVEDASEAFGARYHGRRLGGVADYTVYSFYATKHLSAGEGAAMLVKDGGEMALARRLRRYGIDAASQRLGNGDLNPQLDITVAGFNFPMNEIAATLGLAGLSEADVTVEAFQANGQFYETALAAVPGLRLLKRDALSASAYWTYALLAERRDDLVRKLTEHGIGAQRLHIRNDGFTCFGGVQADLPGTAAFDADNLAIPSGWWVGPGERARIVDCLRGGW